MEAGRRHPFSGVQRSDSSAPSRTRRRRGSAVVSRPVSAAEVSSVPGTLKASVLRSASVSEATLRARSAGSRKPSE